MVEAEEPLVDQPSDQRPPVKDWTRHGNESATERQLEAAKEALEAHERGDDKLAATIQDHASIDYQYNPYGHGTPKKLPAIGVKDPETGDWEERLGAYRPGDVMDEIQQQAIDEDKSRSETPAPTSEPEPQRRKSILGRFVARFSKPKK